MRILKLQPLAQGMSGADVLLWQKFLTQVGFPAGKLDCQFGPTAAKQSKAYQSSVGLPTADGIVDGSTVERARQDGFQPPTIMGFDTNTSCEKLADCLHSAGMEFVVRYYSKFKSKVLTRTEALALSTAGFDLVAVFENDANIANFTGITGTPDANTALACATAVGQPNGTGIYFAVDFPVTKKQVSGQITDYFQAVNAALSSDGREFRVGVYGSGIACQMLQDAGLATLTWTSQSTSFLGTAEFCLRANMAQSNPTRTICGKLSIDDNVALTADFGAFRVS